MARKRKLSKAEKIEQGIRLQLRRQERAVEMQVKASAMLRSSAQALARLHKYQRKLETKVAHDLMTTQVESPPPAPPPVEIPKPKRQRKPKTTDGFPPPTTEMQQERAKRMEAMGFRKTSKRKVAEPAEKQ